MASQFCAIIYRCKWYCTKNLPFVIARIHDNLKTLKHFEPNCEHQPPDKDTNIIISFSKLTYKKSMSFCINSLMT